MARVNKILFLLLSIPFLFPCPVRAADDTSLDQQLAARYGLDVPPAAKEVKPAPQWVRQAEIVASSAAVWKGYEFLLKETPVTRIVRARAGHRRVQLVDYYPVEKVSGIDAESVRGVPLLSHVPHSAEVFRLAHEHGIRAIPYVHFMCIHTNYADQDVFYFEHPEILVKDAQGHWVHTGMDGSDRLHRFRTCANSPSYWKLSLAYVKRMIDWGADGVFVDNAGWQAVIAATLGSFVVHQSSHGATFCVAPGGKDGNPGTKEQPLATLEAARDLARKAGAGPHRIIVMPGEYFLTKPLELDSRDNGLTIEAEQSGKAMLYGGKLVTGWRRDGDKFWYADLAGVKEGTWDFRTLIVNGRMPQRARFPESGEFLNRGTWNLPLLPAVGGYWERKPTQEELTTMPYDPKDIPETLDVKNAEVRLYHMWDESLVGVASNETQRHALIFSTPAIWPPGALGLKKYVIWNTREGMTQPGQWYLDRTAGRLVYWPLPGEDITQSKVIAPTTERMIRISGNPNKKAEKIAIRGMTLQATTVPLKPASFGAGAFDGALSMALAHQCALEGLEICNVGGLGISARQLTDCRIVDCRIHHTGACGVKIDGSDTLIAHNHIHDVGVHYPSAAASMMGGRGLHILRNEIHDAPYSGVIAGGKDHRIEENLIYRVMREMQDGAAIYGNLANCILRGNLVRDVVKIGEGFGVSAYYLDEGAHDCIVERNVSVGVARPTHNHIARNITIRDNVFIADKDMALSFQSSAGCTFEGNTLFAPGKITITQPNGIKLWRGNVVFRNGLGKNDAPQSFTIDDAVPPIPTPGRKTWPAEVVRVAKAPALDGESTPAEWPGKIQQLDRDPSRQPACGAPVFVKFSYDDRFLYVAATVTMFEPAKISNGTAWGEDDGVEICIAGKTPDGKPATFVVRGYANGTVQSVADAGAPADAVERLGTAARFAAKIVKGPRGNAKGWRGQWAIPFDALGLKPAPGLKIPFNMGAFCSEHGEWHCWEGTLAETWRLDQAGTFRLQ